MPQGPFHFLLSILALGVASSVQGQDRLVLNEIVSSNLSGPADEYEEDLQNCPVPDCARWYADLGRSPLDGEYPDWIEIFNGTAQPISLEGYGLSDASPGDDKSWRFPAVELEAGGYLVVFASGKNKHQAFLHTDFKLSRTGETLRLLSPTDEVVDQVDIGELPVDYARARDPENPEKWITLSSPTPGEANAGRAFSGFTDAVSADPPAGFYARFPPVTLTCSDPQAEIRYTLNGAVPGPEDTLYSRPITAIFGGDRVIRARCFVQGQAVSPVLTQSYVTERTFTMPVISLSTAPENLWDEDTGIYTPGRNAREGDRVANYWNDWERPVHVEFFEADGSLGFAAEAGLRIFGWGSRSDAQKSLSLMFRDRYGVRRLDYPVFPDERVTSFKSLVLRAAGSDSRSNGTFFRDPFASGLLRGRNLDVQASRPAVVYLNGQYWGIQNIREKMNEDFLASHHPVDADEVDIISRYWRRTHPVVIEGDSEHFLAFESFLEDNDLSHDDAYQEALRWIDVDNFIEYTAAQIYLANFDWPGNNNKNWRPRRDDGRWRWLMYDLDYSMGFTSEASYRFDTLSHAMAAGGTGWPNPGWTTLIFRKLTENASFREAFALRLADLANTRFAPAYVSPRLALWQDTYAPEMEHHIQRWKGEGESISSLGSWENNIATVRLFFQERAPYILGHLRDRFQLGQALDLLLEQDPAAGRVKVNSVTVEDLSWQGTYFSGLPVTLTALPRPGYRFVRWEGVPDSVDARAPEVRVDPGLLASEVRPVFLSAPGATNLILIQEINYHSHPDRDSGDWVELVNAYEQTIDLGGWVFTDDTAAHHFVIPLGTQLGAGEALVLCQDLAAFRTRHPGGFALGDLRFGLSNGGERLRLLDAEGNVIDEVFYDDEGEWPSAADGQGHTLVRSDNAPLGWSVSERTGGDPGVNERSAVSAPPLPLGKVRLLSDAILIEGFGSAEGGSFQSSLDLQTWSPWEALPTPADGTVRIPRPLDEPAVYFRLRH